MNRTRKKSVLKFIFEFIKLQLAGNVLFWGTYAGYFAFHELLDWPSAVALASASIVAHIAFFIIDKEWVFSDKTGRRKTSGEIVRFLLFMGVNYFINLGITLGLEQYSGISPYVGQFVAAAFFTVWNFVGLRFWVFREVKHQAITLKKPRRTSRGRRASK